MAFTTLNHYVQLCPTTHQFHPFPPSSSFHLKKLQVSSDFETSPINNLISNYHQKWMIIWMIIWMIYVFHQFSPLRLPTWLARAAASKAPGARSFCSSHQSRCRCVGPSSCAARGPQRRLWSPNGNGTCGPSNGWRYDIYIYIYVIWYIYIYNYIYTYWIQNPKFCGLKTNYRVFLRNSKKTWLFLKNLVISHILVLWWFMMIYDSFSIFQQHHVWFHWGFVVLYEVDSASICAPSDERKHLINGNQNHKQILFDMTPR